MVQAICRMADSSSTTRINSPWPRGNSTGEGSDKFAEAIGKRSGGKMKLNVFPGGALGGDVQTMSAVRAGTVDMTSLSAGLLVSHIKEFSLLDLPYLFESHEESFAVVDGPFGAKLAELLAPKGMVIIGWGGGGFRHLRLPIQAPAQFVID